MKQHFQQRIDDTRQGYLDALQRLKQGKATHPSLKDKKYKINATSIALEAGKSRNPLYHTHKDILEMIQDCQTEVIEKKDSSEIEKLKKKITQLEEDNKKLLSINATLLFNYKTKLIEI